MTFLAVHAAGVLYPVRGARISGSVKVPKEGLSLLLIRLAGRKHETKHSTRSIDLLLHDGPRRFSKQELLHSFSHPIFLYLSATCSDGGKQGRKSVLEMQRAENRQPVRSRYTALFR